MNRPELIETLATQQQRLLNSVHSAGDDDYRIQFHPDLSPLGWHLGHCVFSENFWIRETVMGDPAGASKLKAHYLPELSPKASRGCRLPPLADLCRWAEETQHENLNRLRSLVDSRHGHPLLEAGFLIRFLIEHYAQHHETTLYIYAQRSLQRSPDRRTVAPLRPAPLSTAAVTVNGGRQPIGANGKVAPYDNERGSFSAAVQTFHIARRPVSNAEYLSFIEGGGYENTALWTGAGRAWCDRNGSGHPEHWRRNDSGWYCVDETGTRDLAADDPVSGVNHHEASAFARWAGARLPHEYEWESAARRRLLERSGAVWEWCANVFHPYIGFAAFPYEGYSVPYFDGRHFTLRGGSRLTQAPIRRPTFRNYYTAEKRHICAGIRLVFD